MSKHQLYQLYCEYEVDEYEDIAETERYDDGPLIVTYSDTSKPNNAKPYLILDVRDSEEFNSYHLMQARTFPYVMLRRDQVHCELYNFRNKDGCLIIVVDDDEKIAHEAAQVLVNRGTDNIFLLTGGILEFAQDFPSYVEGNLPSHKLSPRKAPSRTCELHLIHMIVLIFTCNFCMLVSFTDTVSLYFTATSSSNQSTLSEAKLAAHNTSGSDRGEKGSREGSGSVSVSSRTNRSALLKVTAPPPSASATALAAMRKARDSDDTVSTRSIASKGGQSTTSNLSGMS